MQYLVTGEFIDPGPLLPPISLLGCSGNWSFLLTMPLRTRKQKESLRPEGYSVGERAGAFIFEANPNEELAAMLQGLPYWGAIKFKITPLQDVEGRRERDLQQVEQLEQILQR